MLLVIAAHNFQVARDLEKGFLATRRAERKPGRTVFCMPGANDMRGYSLNSGDWVVFDRDLISHSGEPAWGMLESIRPALACSGFKPALRQRMDDYAAFEIVPDISAPPSLDDPEAVARWLLS